MPQISSLTEFLEATGTQLHAYDMGRRVCPISRDEFVQFEHANKAYPLPLQRQAWIGLLLRANNDEECEPSVWFIRLPLDEQGKLVLAARDEFVQHLLQAAGKNLQAAEAGEKMHAALDGNPYAFQPKAERLAVFHAKITEQLSQPPSRYYDHARAYFRGELGWDQWSFLGYQGIADVAARLKQDDNAILVSLALPQLPPSPFEALCHCLENEVIPTDICKQIVARASLTLQQDQPDPRILTAAIRGISQATSVKQSKALYLQVLLDDIALSSDILAAIAGRGWEMLNDPEIKRLFLLRLADNDQGQTFFNSILSDLLYLPETRHEMLSSLRNPDRPSSLDRTIGEFFNSVKKT